jgi:uncharacterized protein with PIN domain
VEERFLADRNLGTLAKWLRILGYDTLYDRRNADRAFLQRAEALGRTALTRRRALVGLPHRARLVLVGADRISEQLAEVFAALGSAPDPARRMSLCLKCNMLLEGIVREEIEGLVPAYVYERYREFRRCPVCRKIFWPGTHRRHVEELLTGRNPAGHP